MKYTDEQYAMIEDIKTRKDIARSAKHIKNGSKSKKCSLPSDYLTKKEKEAMNGELKTVNLNVPMKYADFKELSASLKKEYVEHLRDVYHARRYEIADMLGASHETFKNLCNNLHVSFPYGGGVSHKNLEEHAKEWRAFLNGEFDKTIKSDIEIASPSETMMEMNSVFADNFEKGLKEAQEELNVKLQEDGIISSKDICNALGYGVGSEETGWIPKKELTPIHVEDIDETYILMNIDKHKQAKKDFRNSLNKYLKSSLDVLLDTNYDDSERVIAKFNQLLELYMFDEVRTVVKEKHNDIF